MIRTFYDPVKAVKNLRAPPVVVNQPAPRAAAGVSTQQSTQEAEVREQARERVRLQARRRQGTASTLIAGRTAGASSTIRQASPTLLSG